MNFALIGHQDSWEKIIRFTDFFSHGKSKASLEKVKEIYSYIPPRKLFDIDVESITGQSITGCYIETFISPDDLVFGYWKKNVEKVKDAADCARSSGAGIAALGGFTSIVLEGTDNSLNENSATKFTTGNSLTAAFIVKSIEKACKLMNKEINKQQVLIIGATGDIGSACVQYFAGKVKKLLLCARQVISLQGLSENLNNRNYPAVASMDVNALLPEADIIIAIANSIIENFNSSLCKKDVIICDAGYPKNLLENLDAGLADRLFFGGMGMVNGKYSCHPDIGHQLYDFPFQNIAHGCLLEAVVLSLGNMYIPYSTGKGNINPEKIEEIYSLANKHGITEAPFFNTHGAWD